ncbi:VOC family protein [Peribacillus alkalitolerans]|uniref:VOC family protein n=1 Tax=Peribacillus alkalitolerans TaxID=1550385 RepID=UPI0013D7CBAD|nr:VOC family protein [Peribacillus alkalitolerans]
MDIKPKINIVTLPVDNLKRALRFYRDTLGLKTQGIANEASGGDHILFELENELSLVLFLRKEMDKISGKESNSLTTPLSSVILSHYCESEKEVNDLFEKITNSEGLIKKPLQKNDWGYSFYFSDPDENLWEILCFNK